MALPLAIWTAIGVAVALLVHKIAFAHQIMRALPTSMLGIAGAITGGAVGNTLRGGPPLELHTASVVGAAVGATLVLVVASLSRRHLGVLGVGSSARR